MRKDYGDPAIIGHIEPEPTISKELEERLHTVFDGPKDIRRFLSPYGLKQLEKREKKL